MVELSASQARRLALAAQGFTDPRPTGRVDRRHLRRVLDRIGMLQIDSVNVLVRSHYVPLFSRLGPYPVELLDDAAYRRGELFEYWGHAASLMPSAMHPLLRWRMEHAARGATWGGLARLAREKRDYVEAVYEEVARRGGISASELSEPGERSGPWWGWGDGKRALEWLHWTGRLAAVRRPSFERVYDLPERVLPPEVLDAPTVAESQARTVLLAAAARSMGVATAADLADYHRQKVPAVRPLLQRMVEDGHLLAARVEGWRQPAYLHPEARVPRRVDARALLSPFDSLIWNRDRTERLFGCEIRLEVYTPAPARRWGYYVLPFLLGERIAARVDLKADRSAGTLRVLAAHAEPGGGGDAAVEPLAAELADMAGWLGLQAVHVHDRGDLAPPLRAALRGAGPTAARRVG